MSSGALTVFDGTDLRSFDLSRPELGGAVTGAQLLELAESKASESLYGLSLPPYLKTAAVSRICTGDDVTFRRAELSPDQASDKFRKYISAVADGLRDEPLVVSILDGSTLRLFLEDEDDFAMLAENLFTDLDVEDRGKLCKSKIRNALSHMGIEMGVPPFSEFTVLNEILKKHGAEGEEALGQAQFAQLLQPVLQEIADALHEKPVVVIQNIKIFDGYRLRKLLADEKQLKSFMEMMLREKPSGKDGQRRTELIVEFLEKNGKHMGLPPLSKDNQAVSELYDGILSETDEEKRVVETEDGFQDFVKKILEKFAEQLEVNPLYCEIDK